MSPNSARNRISIPELGLGLWKIEKSDAANLVQEAIGLGYRHFDAACDYGNEAEVGAGLAAALQRGDVRREELWVTSKLWNTYHRAEHVKAACQRSLADLQVDYLDLYLVHFPISLRFVPFEERYPPGWFFDPEAAHPRMELDRVSLAETWQAMEELVAEGLVKHIGVCNMGTSLIRDLLAYAKVPPSVLQVESHPYLTQDKLLRFCHEEGLVYTAFSPLGAGSYIPLGMATSQDSVLEDPTILELSQVYERTPAQIVLRWGIQRQTVVIPKTSHVERLQENAQLFDFELKAEDMQRISGLDRHQRFNDPGVFCELGFNTFCPIYE